VSIKAYGKMPGQYRGREPESCGGGL